ncbi:hypothetical protein DRI50_09545 [candidate division KSB1 bacterium]|nr:MAG: hypothetical protein DRI50_09545 [candidate division KSB1 bacterium]
MSSLQELYDFYLETNPSTGKIRNATNFLIHACQAMDVASPEDIVDEKLEDLPDAIDQYFAENHQKAIHDKGVLAEMIGRYGPRDGWENVYRKLLRDHDENLRQFALQALEFSARKDPAIALPYIEKFKNGKNKLMRRVAALLILRMLCSKQRDFIMEHVLNWAKDDAEFLRIVIDLLQHQAENSLNNLELKLTCQDVLQWLNAHLKNKHS